eukprot:1244914-Amphidinium_carterae.1
MFSGGFFVQSPSAERDDVATCSTGRVLVHHNLKQAGVSRVAHPDGRVNSVLPSKERQTSMALEQTPSALPVIIIGHTQVGTLCVWKMKPALSRPTACRRTCPALTMMRFAGLRENNWEVPRCLQHLVLPPCKIVGLSFGRGEGHAGACMKQTLRDTRCLVPQSETASTPFWIGSDPGPLCP